MRFQPLFRAARPLSGHQNHQVETGAEQRLAGGDVRQEQQMESQGSRWPGQETRLDRTASGTMATVEASAVQAVNVNQVLRELVSF